MEVTAAGGSTTTTTIAVVPLSSIPGAPDHSEAVPVEASGLATSEDLDCVLLHR